MGDTKKGIALFGRIVLTKNILKKERYPMNSIIQELMNSALKESFQDLQVLLHGELTFDSLVEQLKQRFLE